jgi:hypothetical protein
LISSSSIHRLNFFFIYECNYRKSKLRKLLTGDQYGRFSGENMGKMGDHGTGFGYSAVLLNNNDGSWYVIVSYYIFY